MLAVFLHSKADPWQENRLTHQHVLTRGWAHAACSECNSTQCPVNLHSLFVMDIGSFLSATAACLGRQDVPLCLSSQTSSAMPLIMYMPNTHAGLLCWLWAAALLVSSAALSRSATPPV
eukprot:GHRQ01034731.1.p1 GENE.GHRQ01034731.1~~GHRQ01034731.1.p1  ORF type:complete len:119 (-),score=9.94 GHRQ01034731.1:661-1017(-)